MKEYKNISVLEMVEMAIYQPALLMQIQLQVGKWGRFIIKSTPEKRGPLILFDLGLDQAAQNYKLTLIFCGIPAGPRSVRFKKNGRLLIKNVAVEIQIPSVAEELSKLERDRRSYFKPMVS